MFVVCLEICEGGMSGWMLSSVYFTLLYSATILRSVSLLKIASCFDRVLWFVFFFVKEPLLTGPLLFRGA